jgi:nucleosome binding factor SPN SPT16 subunit
VSFFYLKDDTTVDDTTQHAKPLDKRDRRAHPERITIGSETLERNDIYAQRLCMSERRSTEATRKVRPTFFSVASNTGRSNVTMRSS